MEQVYKCPSEPIAGVLAEAVSSFNPYTNKYEYNRKGFGYEWNPVTDRYGVNCWYVVASTLSKLGFEAPLYQADWPATNFFDPDYFCLMDWNQAGPGDILVWAPDPEWQKNNPNKRVSGHIDILDSVPVKEGLVWHFFSYGAQAPGGAPDYGIYSIERFTSTQRGQQPRYVGAILRPKILQWELNCVFPNPPKDPPRVRRDPLILDLNGNGIETLGLSAGIHFDHDANGLKELTGWVAPGDGMLMLDKNGNGRLDDSTELFGDIMILPDSMRAGNGFETLAYYDANSDGKIDFSDPIWPELKIWQHSDYEFFEGEG